MGIAKNRRSLSKCPNFHRRSQCTVWLILFWLVNNERIKQNAPPKKPQKTYIFLLSFWLDTCVYASFFSQCLTPLKPHVLFWVSRQINFKYKFAIYIYSPRKTFVWKKLFNNIISSLVGKRLCEFTGTRIWNTNPTNICCMC